jgi:hypothetical protein
MDLPTPSEATDDQHLVLFIVAGAAPCDGTHRNVIATKIDDVDHTSLGRSRLFTMAKAAQVGQGCPRCTSTRRGILRDGYGADLTQQTKGVPVDPFLDEFAVDDTAEQLSVDID